MISMRYAWNFAHGQGLVWNAGQRIEGYSNLLMTLLMSAAALFLNKPLAVLAVQLFGVITLLAVAFITKQMTDEINAGRPYQRLIGIVALVCVLFYYPLTYWTLMGMETGLLTLLLMAAALFALRWIKDSPHPGPAEVVPPGRACFPHPQRLAAAVRSNTCLPSSRSLYQQVGQAGLAQDHLRRRSLSGLSHRSDRLQAPLLWSAFTEHLHTQALQLPSLDPFAWRCRFHPPVPDCNQPWSCCSALWRYSSISSVYGYSYPPSS